MVLATGGTIASTYDEDTYENEAPVLKRLSEDFELCSTGLNKIKQEPKNFKLNGLKPKKKESEVFDNLLGEGIDDRVQDIIRKTQPSEDAPF